jgi:hypothetical protein
MKSHFDVVVIEEEPMVVALDDGDVVAVIGSAATVERGRNAEN